MYKVEKHRCDSTERGNKYTNKNNKRSINNNDSSRNSKKILYHKAELEYETNIVQMKSILLENIIRKLKTVVNRRQRKNTCGWGMRIGSRRHLDGWMDGRERRRRRYLNIYPYVNAFPWAWGCLFACLLWYCKCIYKCDAHTKILQ